MKNRFKKLPHLKKVVKSKKYYLGIDVDIDVKSRIEIFVFTVMFKERDTTIVYQNDRIINHLQDLSQKPSLEYIEELEKHFNTKAIKEEPSNLSYQRRNGLPVDYNNFFKQLQING